MSAQDGLEKVVSDQWCPEHGGPAAMCLPCEVTRLRREYAEAQRQFQPLLRQVEVLRDERDEAERERREEVALRERLYQLLDGVARALKGEPPPLVRHDFSDLPEVAATVRADRDEALENAKVAVTALGAAIVQLKVVGEEVARLRAMLREVEWASVDRHQCCPVCHRVKEWGHAPDCLLHAALEGRDG